MKHYDRLHDLRKFDSRNKLAWSLTLRNYKKKNRKTKGQRGLFSCDWRLSWNRRNQPLHDQVSYASVGRTNLGKCPPHDCGSLLSEYIPPRIYSTKYIHTAKSRVVEASLKLPGAELSPYLLPARSLSPSASTWRPQHPPFHDFSVVLSPSGFPLSRSLSLFLFRFNLSHQPQPHPCTCTQGPRMYTRSL